MKKHGVKKHGVKKHGVKKHGVKKHGVKKMVVGSSARNSAPNVDKDLFAQLSPPLNFPPMQHGRQKQWQIIHS